MDSSEYALLKLHLTPGLGRAGLFKLYHCFRDFSAALAADGQRWQQLGLPARLYERIPPDSDPILGRISKQIDRLGIRLLSFWDDGYPALLKEIHDPPALLYVRGTLPTQNCFAIVGSRRASAAGLKTTTRLATDLARRDICIVSGLARGIDSAAHRGALAAAGATIAVLGCGIDRAYPQENSRLFSEILHANAIISEYPPGTPPLAGHFPGRNRIISGLSRGVLIVEAGEGSGSLITGDFALEQGRELFAIPGSLHQNNSVGTNRLLKEGAQLVTEVDDILLHLWPERLTDQQHQQQQSLAPELDAPARQVFDLLSHEPLQGDEIAQRCGLTPMELSTILLDLELRGAIKVLPGQHFIRC